MGEMYIKYLVILSALNLNCFNHKIERTGVDVTLTCHFIINYIISYQIDFALV